jgi:ABC-type multidrug transport system ATPase subunit
MNGNGSRGGGAAIRASGLAKDYGEVRAVRKVDLDVRRGEIYGFLGRNGAGKTTTIRMLLGLIKPTAGEIELFGSTLRRDRALALRRVGYFVESAAAYPNLTVRENLEIQRRLTGSPKGAAERVIALLGLGEYAGRRAGRLSLGNKQRLSLARALLHEPELLILDEPANGLDPAGIVEVRTLLRSLADERGVTIFMSSHLLDEVEQLADRIGIVHEGRLVEEVDVARMRAEGRSLIVLEVDDASRAEKVLREELGLTELAATAAAGLSVSDRGARPEAIARALVGAGIGLRRLEPVAEDLERHFMRVTGGEE